MNTLNVIYRKPFIITCRPYPPEKQNLQMSNHMLWSRLRFYVIRDNFLLLLLLFAKENLIFNVVIKWVFS